MKQFRSSSRLSGQILRDISTMMEGELSERLSGMITFTNVRLTDDLKYATIYYSVLGEDESREKAADYFEREKKRIRHMVGKNLRMRFIPEFRFKYDPSVEEGMRIEQLLNEIKNDSGE